MAKTIVDLGMNRPGEIARLTEISDPDVEVITNLGKLYLEGLGSTEDVAKAKIELVENMSPGGRIILNGDGPLFLSMARAR